MPTTLSEKTETISVRGYHQVVKITDQSVGLRAIIAIHDLTLGPALGGTRIHPYANFDAALEDALRLARGMTYKAALAGLGLGGGKSVIIADPKSDKTPELLHAFGAAVERLRGSYIAAEDVGCTPADVAEIHKATRYVVGLHHAKSSGNPAPFTAWGVFRSIQATAKRLFGSDSLEGLTIAIQGLGAVGAVLAELLFWSGARLIVSDIDALKTTTIARKYGAAMRPPDQILSCECDLLAPCAMGGILNDVSIPKLRCKAIAGAANNQLLQPEHAMQLKQRGVLYAPDFVINAGGLLNVSVELEPSRYAPDKAQKLVHAIYDTLLSVYEMADKNQESTHNAAVSLAEYRIKYGIGKRSTPPVFHHATN
ncbi:MAG: leucine dehydrogenase [Chlamydiota bacterium]|jgi:leucine dehydrogenase